MILTNQRNHQNDPVQNERRPIDRNQQRSEVSWSSAASAVLEMSPQQPEAGGNERPEATRGQRQREAGSNERREATRGEKQREARSNERPEATRGEKQRETGGNERREATNHWRQREAGGNTLLCCHGY
ncbi:uncharacterized protein V6R79_014104 [Siganus canaliculatus]